MPDSLQNRDGDVSPARTSLQPLIFRHHALTRAAGDSGVERCGILIHPGTFMIAIDADGREIADPFEPQASMSLSDRHVSLRKTSPSSSGEIDWTRCVTPH
jgi:hypothetical protein